MNQQLLQATYRNIFVDDDGTQTVFCYRTGMTVYEEVFLKGRLMSAGWNTAGYTLNVLESFPTRFAGYSRNLFGNAINTNGVFRDANAFEIEADGVALDGSWELVDFQQTEEVVEVTNARVIHGRLHLKSSRKPVEVVVHTQLDGTPVLSRWIEIRNTSCTCVNISRMMPMGGGLEVIDDWKEYMQGAPDSSRIYSLGYMDHAEWGHEGYFKWHNLPNIQYGIGGKCLHEQRYRQPFFMLENKLLGTMMIGQLGWTGGWDFQFNLDTEQNKSKLSFAVSLRAQNPMLILKPNESFTFPTMHIGMLNGDLDDAVNSMHKHIRKSVFTNSFPMDKKGWIVGGMGPERLMDVKATKHFVDTVAYVGAETMNIDAGWFCPPNKEQTEWFDRVGDWHPDQERYPNGIEEIRDYIHEKGLRFGLWVQLESLGEYCTEMRTAHPDWNVTDVNGSPCYMLDMTNPEVVAWAEGELSRIIEEYGLDLFRLDFNFTMDHMLYCVERDNIPESSYLRYYHNTIAMYDRLKKKYPDVIFENCAGGGCRCDLEFVKAFTHTWVSDWQIAPRSFAITNGMTMVLPPEYVDRLVSGMKCHTMGSLDFQVRNTIFGRPSTNDYNCIDSDWNPDQINFVKHTFAIYKDHIRPYIDESEIYHHTPELVSGHKGAACVVEHPQGVGVIERASSDGRHSVVGIFKLADAGEDNEILVYPKGISPALSYRVTYDNLGVTTTVPGFTIHQDGLKVRMNGSLTSELLILEAE